MKPRISQLALGAIVFTSALATAFSDQSPLAIPEEETDNEPCLIEIAPGDTRWVSEDEKWELKRVRCHATNGQFRPSPAKLACRWNVG